MMHKLLTVVLAVVVIASLVIAGCAKPAPAPTPSPAPGPTPAPTPAPAPEVIKLTWAEQDPAIGWAPSRCWQPLIKKIEEATSNRVIIDYYPAQTLCKGTDAWKSVESGVTDIAWCFHGYWADMTPLADVITLPSLPFESAKQASGILWKLYEKYPSIREEFKDNHVLLLWASTPYILITTEKQVKTLEDLKGMKIRTTGGPPNDQMAALGAKPVAIPMPDCYLALSKGVIDGMAAPHEAILDNRLCEAVKYYTYVNLSCVYFSIAVNNDLWNSLPPDVQDQINSVAGGLTGSEYGGYYMFDTAKEAMAEEVRKMGFPIIEYTLPPDEAARWEEIGGSPLWENWVKKMEAEGHPEAREILNTTLELIKTYKP